MPAFNSIAGRIRHVACIAVLLALAGCAHVPANPPQPWRDAGQLVLVTVADWNADHGQLRSFERDDADDDNRPARGASDHFAPAVRWMMAGIEMMRTATSRMTVAAAP